MMVEPKAVEMVVESVGTSVTLVVRMADWMDEMKVATTVVLKEDPMVVVKVVKMAVGWVETLESTVLN